MLLTISNLSTSSTDTMATKATIASCDICCEAYNKSTHKQVCCEHGDCEFSACKICVRTYLVGTTADPNCMKCKKPWTENFLVANINRSFCEKEYKIHRKTLLVDRELSRLPETMPIAERHIKAANEEKKIDALNDQAAKLYAQLSVIQNEKDKLRATVHEIRHGKAAVASERQKFIMACPNNICRGYLSTQYKCELCELFTCPDCLEIIGHAKTEAHTCNPDSVASAALIKKETKGCPQCGVRIFKISGCNQMWCTECKVAFDYSTGKIDTGVVHNPHYYAHIATLNQGAAPRNPQDVLCGGLVAITSILRCQKFRSCFPGASYGPIMTKIQDVHRVIAHITHHELPRLRTEVRQLQDGEDLRIDYIMGKIDKATLGATVYKRDTKRKKQTDLLHIYELGSVVGIETFAMLIDPASLALKDKAFVDLIDEKMVVFENLRKYCNDEFAKISITYNLTVMWIQEAWVLGKGKKYTMKKDQNQDQGSCSTDPVVV